MTEAATISKPTIERLPWPFIGAALVAFAALYFSGDRFVAMLVLAVPLLLAWFAPFRLPNNKVFIWLLRLAMWALIIATGPERRLTGTAILFEPYYIHMFGFLAAAEIVLRAWVRTAGGPSRGEAMLLTALIVTAASSTYDRVYVHTLAPVYAILTLLSLRTFGPPRMRGEQPRHRALVAMRIGAAMLALGIGFVVIESVTKYDQRLMQWATDLIGSRRRANTTEIGLTTSPRLQAVYNPQPSMNRVLLIDGPRAERHLRAMAFDVYEGRQWRPALRERAFTPITPNGLQTSSTGQRLQFTRVGETFDLLVLPSNTAAVRSEAAIERDDLGSLRNQEQSADDPHYAANVPTDEQFQGPLWLPMDQMQRQRALTVPAEIDPKVLAMSRQIAGDDSPAARVRRIAQHLRSGQSYSLSYDPGDADPLSDFILNRRAAHCQYFASAMVIMARAAGVPARYVTGYYAHETSGENWMVVRDRDAHAWAECWIDGIGWMTFDATPASGLPDQLFSEPSAWRKLSERIADIPRIVREWLAKMTRRTVALLFAGPASVAIIVGSVVAVWRRRRPKIQAARGYAPLDAELAAVAKRFERWLRRRAERCAPNRTWREHLATLELGTARPIDRAACIDFIDAYDEARFGGSGGQSLSRLRRRIERLERHRG